jgi:hypothetical protein
VVSAVNFGNQGIGVDIHPACKTASLNRASNFRSGMLTP